MDISDAIEEIAAGSPHWGRSRQGQAMALLRQIAKEHRDLRAENEPLCKVLEHNAQLQRRVKKLVEERDYWKAAAELRAMRSE